MSEQNEEAALDMAPIETPVSMEVPVQEPAQGATTETTPAGGVSQPTILLVRQFMSGGMNVEDRTDETSHVERRTYVYDKEKRTKSAVTRAKYTNRVSDICVHFHGLRACLPSERQLVADTVAEADRELQAIDPSLHASVVFLPVGVEPRGELARAIVTDLLAQMTGQLAERLRVLVAKDPKVTARGRAGLIATCDRLKQWNILGDEVVNRKLEEYKTLFKGEVAAALDKLNSDITALQGEGAYLEL